MKPVMSTVIIYLAAVLLFITAAFHFTGLDLARDASQTEGIQPLIGAVLETLWTIPTVHWIAFGLLAGLLYRVGSALGVALVAVVVLADGFMVFRDLGPFIGALALMGTGGLLLLAAALMVLRKRAQSF